MVAAACTSMLFVNSLSLGAAFLALKEKLSPGQDQELLMLLSLLAYGCILKCVCTSVQGALA